MLVNKLAKLRRHASRVHFARIHLGKIHFGSKKLGDGGDLLGDGCDLLGDGVNLLGDGGDPRSIAGGSSKMTVAQKCPGAMEITKNCKEPGGVQLCTVEVCKIKIDALQKKSLYCVKQCTKGHSVQHQGHQKQ